MLTSRPQPFSLFANFYSVVFDRIQHTRREDDISVVFDRIQHTRREDDIVAFDFWFGFKVYSVYVTCEV